MESDIFSLKKVYPKYLLRRLALFCILSFAPCSYLLSAQISAPKAVFVSPGAQSNAFWQSVIGFMQQAADNLGVALQVVHTGGMDSSLAIDAVRRLCVSELKPDYVILVNYRNSLQNQVADDCGIKSVLFNGAFTPDVERRLRTGPKALKHWIGSVLPDERQSGYLVAKALADRARELKLYDGEGKIQLAGVNGSLASITSALRAAGLEQYVAESDDLVLTQVVPAFWEREKSHELSARLLKRFPEVKVLWSAADMMSLGAVSAIRDANLVPGEDVLTAGVDWLPMSFAPIERGEVFGSVGGHLFDGAWVMVKLIDHYHGHVDEFFDIKTKFFFAGKDELPMLKELLKSETWGTLDFRQFSKHYGATKEHVFGVGLILQQLHDGV